MSTPSVRPFRLALFFGLSAGWAEVSIIGVRRFAQDLFVLVDGRVLWMTPLSYVVLMAPVAGALLVAQRRAPTWVPARWTVFVASVIPLFAVLWFAGYPGLHRMAILLLALGGALQISRMVASRLAPFQEAIRPAILVMIVLSSGSGLVFHGLERLAERREVSNLPATAEGAPNILLLILDTVRASSLSLYGNVRATTPFLDSLAERGIVFEHAYATAPWTLPSHATLFTGRYPHQLSTSWTSPLDDTHPTLAEGLGKAGYRTSAFVANLFYLGREVGLDRGFQRYEDYPMSLPEVVMSSALGRFVVDNPRLRETIGYYDTWGRRTAGDIVDAFLEWQPESGARPFFAFLNFYDAHEPYLPGEAFEATFTSGTPRRNHLIRHATRRSADRIAKNEMSEPERREEERAYEASIAYVDAEIGRLYAELESRGHIENTLIVVTSDHGELFGGHDLFTHGGSLYSPELHVPLLLVLPGGGRGLRVGEAVSLRDVPATVLDVVGTDESKTLPGTSLAFLWSGTPGDSGSLSPILSEVEPAENQLPGLPSEAGPMKSLVRFPWHYVRLGDGTEQLFDLVRDPGELRNLSTVSEHEAPLAELRTETRRLARNGG